MSRSCRCLLAATVVLMLALAGCGGTPARGTAATSPSTATAGDAAAFARTPAAQIESDVEAALKGATSLHMAGSIIEHGDQVDFDVSVDTSGDCTGTMGLHGTTLHLLGVAGRYYFKASRAFWAAQDPAHAAQIWALVGGKWVAMGGGAQGGSQPGGQSAEMSSLCNLTQLTRGLFGHAGPGPTSVIGPSRFQGQPTVKLAGRSAGGAATTIQVLAAEPHYPVRVDAGSQGEMTFSRFDQPVEVAAPSPSERVDLSRLG